MKKVLVFLLIIVMISSLQGCGKSDAVKTAEKTIKEIGTVTLDSKTAIEEAKQLIDQLSEEDLKKVENINVLDDAQTTYESLCVEELINKIQTVSLNSETAINNARKLYDSANDTVKSKVSNYSVLENAEKTLKELKEKEEQKKKEQEQAKANNVINLIIKIGTVTLKSGDAIEKANSEYSKLSNDTKKLVTNYSILTAAQKKYKELQKAELKAAYDSAISRITIDKDDISKRTFYISIYSPTYTNERCHVHPYIETYQSTNWLWIRYDYTGNDWVFYKGVIIAVDDQRYTKTFKYSSITHDVGGGMVAECIDENAGKDDIEMLRAIVNSTKTTVRFKGDNRYYDYTFNNNDKQAINDILAV